MKNNCQLFISVCLFNLWFIFSSFFLIANSPNDSLKQTYPLNDPRNPNCPCHKYQKLAEDEFRKNINDKKELVLSNSEKIKRNYFDLNFRKKHFNSRLFIFMNKRNYSNKKVKKIRNLCYKF